MATATAMTIHVRRMVSRRVGQVTLRSSVKASLINLRLKARRATSGLILPGTLELRAMARYLTSR